MKETKEQWMYLIIIILTIIDLVFIGIVVFYHASGEFRYNVIYFDLFVCSLMWAEFIYSFKYADNRKQYLKDNSLSILGMLPIDFVFFRVLRLVKLVQLIKEFVLARGNRGSISRFLKRTYLDKMILVSIIFLFSVALLINIVDSNITNMADAVWYIVVSMTSTGYGDIVPASPSGRILGMVAMLGGILIFSSFTAVISSVYVSRLQKDHKKDFESKIDELTAEIERLNKKIDEL